MAERTLYELAGRGEVRFSPYCWRTLFALLHKGLDFERVAMKFTDRASIAASGQDRVPVLDDGGRVVADSWAIACHLEDRYPGRPSLFGGAIGRGLSLMINKWADGVVLPSLRPLAVPATWAQTDPADSDWFRADREKRFGRTLEDLASEGEQAIERFRIVLEPARAALAQQPFLCGPRPAYGDYILLGTLMWPRVVTGAALLADDDPVAAWEARMRGLFDGYAANAPTHAAA